MTGAFERRRCHRRPQFVIVATAAVVAVYSLREISRTWLSPARAAPGRRELLLSSAGAVLGTAAQQPAWAATGASLFKAGDLKVSSEQVLSPGSTVIAPDMDTDKLQEAIYMMSRVQEATVQEERLVASGKFKDMQRNSIKMALNMMIDNYRLGDQVIAASPWVEPKTQVVEASQYGNDAVELLQTAKEYFATDLKVSKLTNDQRVFLTTAMATTREKLDKFLTYLPADKIRAARKRVEDENAKNLKEYIGPDGQTTMINPVKLPWQK